MITLTLNNGCNLLANARKSRKYFDLTAASRCHVRYVPLADLHIGHVSCANRKISLTVDLIPVYNAAL